MHNKPHTKESIQKMREAKLGSKTWNWKGGRKKSHGYVLILKPEHPNSSKDGYVCEHRLVMEEKLGRYLEPTEIVHHKNGVVNDNNIENLMLFANNAEHKKYHGGDE